jgi:hypothetical protein
MLTLTIKKAINKEISDIFRTPSNMETPTSSLALPHNDQLCLHHCPPHHHPGPAGSPRPPPGSPYMAQLPQLKVLTSTSMLTLAGSTKADLLDKLEDQIKAVQNTKANMKHCYNPA